jgi:hypothetical protein
MKGECIVFQRIAVAVIATAGLVLTGCGSGATATKQSASPSPASTTSETYEQCSDGALRVKCDDSPPAVDETTTPPPDEPAVAKVGATEWFTYEDGLKVQVTKLARFKIGPYAAGGKPGGTGVIVTVTIRNGSKATFDAGDVTITVTSGPNGDAADTVYDSDKGLSGGFQGSIPAGRVKTAKAGFAVPAAHMGQIQVEVQPSYEHNSSFFEGAVK